MFRKRPRLSVWATFACGVSCSACPADGARWRGAVLRDSLPSYPCLPGTYVLG
jgi:hypothetical protein